MNRLTKILYSLVLGACGALVAWAVLDLGLTAAGITTDNVYIQAVLNGGLVGLCVGALIAALEKFNNTSRVGPTALGCFVGLLTGLVGGTIGLLLAELLFQNIRLPGDWQQGLRLIGWAMFGLGVGIGPGIATWSLLKMLASSAGGCLGGIAGGIGLILISSLLRLPLSSRAIGFVLLGLFVGLLIALAQEVVKQAELKIVSSGPNEGRRFNIDKKRVTVGSASGNDWVISGDPNLFPQHVEIRQERGKFVVHSMAAQSPALVNRQPIQEQVLNDGDRVRIGATEIAFKARK
jgi:hypothetical protein